MTRPSERGPLAARAARCPGHREVVVGVPAFATTGPSCTLFFLAMLMIAAAPGAVRGDAVYSHDGSKIVGVIEKIADGKLTLCSELLGTLEIDLCKVRSIETSGAVNVELKSGDRLVGVVETNATQDGAAVQSSLGNIAIALADVTNVWRVGATSPTEAKAIARYKPHWSTVVEFGASSSEGNTDTVDVRGKVEVQRKTADDLLRFYATADYGEQRDNRVRNEFRFGSSYEYSFTERVYAYIRGELEHDEFENIDLRATATTGLGYYWLKQEDHELKTRLGVGYRHETYDTGRVVHDPVADLGLDYRLDVCEWMQFTQSTTYTPSLEDFDDYRVDLDTAAVFPLKADGWKLKLGVRNTYNSSPSQDREALDSMYYANVLVELKH